MVVFSIWIQVERCELRSMLFSKDANRSLTHFFLLWQCYFVVKLPLGACVLLVSIVSCHGVLATSRSISGLPQLIIKLFRLASLWPTI